jgi:hypothetical protein
MDILDEMHQRAERLASQNADQVFVNVIRRIQKHPSNPHRCEYLWLVKRLKDKLKSIRTWYMNRDLDPKDYFHGPHGQEVLNAVTLLTYRNGRAESISLRQFIDLLDAGAVESMTPKWGYGMAFRKVSEYLYRLNNGLKPCLDCRGCHTFLYDKVADLQKVLEDVKVPLQRGSSQTEASSVTHGEGIQGTRPPVGHRSIKPIVCPDERHKFYYNGRSYPVANHGLKGGWWTD